MSRKHFEHPVYCPLFPGYLLFVVLELFHDPTSCGKLIVIQMILIPRNQRNCVEMHLLFACPVNTDKFCICLLLIHFGTLELKCECFSSEFSFQRAVTRLVPSLISS